MSKSLPSKEAYYVDIPEVKDASISFKYNFFVNDEQINDIGGVPTKFLQRKSADEDAYYTMYLHTRIPRYVKIEWNKTQLKDPGNQLIESDIRSNAQRASKKSKPNLISSNLDKITDCDHFSALNYVGVSYHGGDIDAKNMALASGSYSLLTFNNQIPDEVSLSSAASYLQSNLPSDVNSQFAHRSMAKPTNYGAKFYNTGDNGVEKNASGRTPLYDDFIYRMKSVYVHSQINSKLFADITGRNIRDPHSPFSIDLHSLYSAAQRIKTSALNNNTNAITESEFQTIVPYVNLRVDKTSSHVQRKYAEIVGYIIDKYEKLSDGTIKQHPPLIVENPDSNIAIDARVKYKAMYTYTIRTVVMFHLPAIDIDSNDIATIDILVSSKPSSPLEVIIEDDTAPPPPSDIDFTWNYETDRLLIHWAFPPNSQRDIKRFQVFRRDNINCSFELLKEFNFDDSAIESISGERPDKRLVERLHPNSPITFFIDDDFKKNSSFIYTVCSIDAHGFVSTYGAQYEIGFDIFKNQLTKKIVSHSGAPRQYPNMFLEGEGFVNVAHTHGSHAKSMKLYFVPQYYSLKDDQNREQRVLATKQTGGMYRFQFINVDNQKMQTLNVYIDDRIRDQYNKITYPAIK